MKIYNKNINSEDLFEISKLNYKELLYKMDSNINGLNKKQIKSKVSYYGLNKVVTEEKMSLFKKIIKDTINPLNILLVILSIISYLTKDIKATIIILAMVVLGTTLKIFQERKADNAVNKLKDMVSTNATVIRNKVEIELPIEDLVPGDMIKLSAGDMIPADIIILSSKDLLINQSSLTGESVPVEKSSKINDKNNNSLFEIENICLLGSNVTSGTAIAMVINTGKRTYFSLIANKIVKTQGQSSFDKGVNSFTWLMIYFIIIMVPLVFLINGLSKNDWLEALIFAAAIAVGLTPEMMPMIISVNLSKGAIKMSKKKVIIKRLNSIQNFGAMDVLCTDKTGTITEGKTTLGEHLDLLGKSNIEVFKYGFLNSYYHTGLKNIMDDTILEHSKDEKVNNIEKEYLKIDEIPFDFDRKRMSVILKNKKTNNNILICKGAFEEVMDCCSYFNIDNELVKINKDNKIIEMVESLNNDGYRVVAIAYKDAVDNYEYEIKDEKDLVLLGFISFFDPPKETAQKAIRSLESLGISVKILTGDNERVTKHICKRVGIDTENIVFGSQIDLMSDSELKNIVENSNVFVKLSPTNKDRIIKTLQELNHVVGFMGDGINDAPALKEADVGISVNTAADIAKESSDIILLDNSLLVLKDGVIEGRKVFGNIVKYTKMAASSNFGNMLSVVGASAFLPFLPMLPIQVLINNLLYDFSQTTIPTDNVDPEWSKVPRKWTMDKIRKFVLLYGPVSSIFDYITFFVMLYIFKASNNPELFHTGWFIESIFTQTLIIHVIRTNKIPFIESKPSKPLIISSIIILITAITLTITPIASTLGFVRLPNLYWLYLFFIICGYLVFTQLVKKIYIKKFDM